VRNAYSILVGKPNGKDRGVGVRIILKWILKEQDEDVD
jgi:hypothetical protein